MSANLSPLLLSKAAAPALGLIGIGIVCLLWQKAIKAIPATLFSLGLALLALLLLVVTAYSFANAQLIRESVAVLLGVPLLVYTVSLGALTRYGGIAAARVVVCGLAGLVPLYFIGGFVLVTSACSLSSGGC